MTKIELTKRGHQLIVREKVKIAEGNINSVQLEVDMADDTMWGLSGAAIFSNDAVENGKTYSVAMMPGEVGDMPDFNFRLCTVPHEVLSESGQLSISLEFAEGSTVEKTTIAKLNVLKSLQHEETVVEPTLNLYLQYVDAMHQKSNEIRGDLSEQITEQLEAQNQEFAETLEAHKKELADHVVELNGDYYTKDDTDEQIDEKIDEKIYELNEEIRSGHLWQSIDLESSFRETSIEVAELKGVNRISILFKNAPYEYAVFTGMVLHGESAEYEFPCIDIEGSKITVYSRTIEIGSNINGDNYINISDCTYYDTENDKISVDNEKLIPVKMLTHSC